MSKALKVSQIIKALKGRVILKRFDAEEKIGSIFVPSEAQKKPQFGTVISVGKGNLDIKPGDVVFFEGAVDKFQHDGEWYHNVKHEDIAGVVEQ